MSLFDHRLKLDLMRKMLLHNRLTRGQIAEAFGLSMPAVTRHVRWLEENDLITLRRVRMPNIKRPVETLHLQGERATGMTALLYTDRIGCEIVAADGDVLHAMEQKIPEPTQLAVVDTLRALVRQAHVFVNQRGQPLETVTVGIHGYLEPTHGMIFGVRGISDWEPCLLGQVIDELHDVAFVPTTSVACKLYGLSARQREDHRIGYIEYIDGMLAIATLHAGGLLLGRFGTASSAIHVRVSDSPRRCFCGRRGCLDDHLRVGDANAEMFSLAMPHMLDTMRVTTLGIEMDGEIEQAADICRQHGVKQVHWCAPDDVLVRQGLRVMCARVMLERLVDRMRPVVRRSIVNPAAFRSKSLDEASPHMAESASP